MIRNYFTLYHAAMELHERLAGGYLIEISSQHKNELNLSFIGVDGRHLQIVIVTHTPLLCLSVKEGAHKKARNSASLMSEVHKQQVSRVDISPSDREIRILLANETTIVLQLFSSNTNVFLVRENHIIDAFKHKNALTGEPWQPGNNSPGVLRNLETLATNQTLFVEQFNSRSEKEIPEKLSAALAGFDRSLVQEVLKRVPAESSAEALFIAFQSVFYELLDPKITVAEKENGEPKFSLFQSPFPQPHFFNSVLEGLTDYSIKMWQFFETKEQLKALRSKLLRDLGKKQKALESFNTELLGEFAQNYETSGHLLMASLYQPRTHRESITVKNIFEQEAPDTTIKLKEALTLQKNAEEYFSKASKTRGKLKVMQGRLTRLEEEAKALEKLLAETDTITTPKEARRFIENYSISLGKSSALSTKNNRAPLPFRVIQLSQSITLLVGKNAANNDLLTFTHARPHDIWLHARGSSGSHCVLKGATLQQLNEIKKAAEIAAWYSSAKHSELVPVLYTLKKYVRHGKHLAPGQVIVEREEVILVKPLKGTE
ncbi:MAG: NFACT RNA binding domain-containing protein [Chlorobiales bacterium]|nr:NFACT RNA binding domain-containing protein [Chlorobiales bacterium]